MNYRKELPQHLKEKYGKELEEAAKSEFWTTPMTKEKLAPITPEECERALREVMFKRKHEHG